MNQNPAPENSAPHDNRGFRQGIAWIVHGHREVRQHRSLWFGMTAVYFLLGFLLKLIPFMGDLLLILISPMLLAGVVVGRAQANRAAQPADARHTPTAIATWLQAWVIQPAQELVRIFTADDKVFGAVLLGIVSLGLVMLVNIAGYLLIGGSMLSGLTASDLMAPQMATLLGMLVVAMLYLVLTMALFYSVPLTMLGNRDPLAAIAESFSICRKNPRPLVTLGTPFFIVYLILMAVFTRYHWLGYLLVFTAGFVTLPEFIASALFSYQSFAPLPLASSRR
ncbi:MAG: hypothetical protein ACYC9J_05030 [Sulfuricaulis sp.]